MTMGKSIFFFFKEWTNVLDASEEIRHSLKKKLKYST